VLDHHGTFNFRITPVLLPISVEGVLFLFTTKICFVLLLFVAYRKCVL
jgi:hypothetical protein